MRRNNEEECKWGCNYIETCLDQGLALAEPVVFGVCVFGDRVR